MVQSIDSSSGWYGRQSHEEHHTIGSWKTEEQSAAALDQALESCGLWRVYREVPGTLIQPRPSQIDKGMRIDRVLTPTARLLELGWTHGVIGIEVKRSGLDLGPALAQAMDYSRSVWSLPGGISTWLDWVFVWPVGHVSGALASICSQHRIGAARATTWYTLQLQSGAFNVITIRRDTGDVEISPARSGKGAGSR